MIKRDIDLNSLVPKVYEGYMLSFIRNEHDMYVLKGGRGSIKSTIASLQCVLKVITGQGNAVCIRRYHNTLYDSCYTDILVVIDRLGIANEFVFKKSPMLIEHIPTGYSIYFRGLDNPIKLKSLKAKKGTFAIMWVEESNEVESMAKIRSTIQTVGRGRGNNLKTVLSYNPSDNIHDWSNKRFEKNKDKKTIVLHVNYNQIPSEWLGELFIREANKLKEEDYEAYENEYLGRIVKTKATIFPKVKVYTKEMQNDKTRQYDTIVRGIDFGFTDDPIVYVAWGFNTKTKELYLVDEIYEKGLELEEFAERIKELHNKEKEGWVTNRDVHLLVYADSAEPRSIKTLQNLGLKNVKPCKKGADSVVFGIKYLRELKAIYIPEDTETYTEFYNYTRLKNRFGEYENKVPDKNNHTIDATRYALQEYINGRRK